MVQNCSYILSQILDYKLFSAVSILVAVAFVLLIISLFKLNAPVLTATGLFLLGSVLNAIDRLRDGCVADYLNFFGLFKFNVFDLMICLGSGLLIYLVFAKKV